MEIASPSMHLIIYISDYTGSGESIEKDLNQISASAKKRNPELEITGALFYHKQKFLQVIEGKQEPLKNLLNILEKDSRHKNISTIIDDQISERAFNDWNMDSFNLNELQYIDENIVMYLKETSYELLTEIEAKVFIDVLKSFLQSQ